jgi:hypothetical protein
MLLGSSSLAVKATMLANAAAHRSAAAELFGLAHRGHATAPAEENAGATLDALEQVLELSIFPLSILVFYSLSPLVLSCLPLAHVLLPHPPPSFFLTHDLFSR